ncbi:MAG: hypothetical protein ACK57B_04190 [Betaproteobacteria bacterium]
MRCLWLAALLHGLALWALGRAPADAPPAPREPAWLELTLRSASDTQEAPPPATAPPRAAPPARERPAAPEPRPQIQPPSPLAASPAVAPGTAMAQPDAPPAGADAEARTGAAVALPAQAASAPRPLNLELGRWRSAEAGPPSVARRVAESENRTEPDPLAAAIEKSARADCARAHSGAGLLAVVPLVLDALRGSGCKW